jgi:hypothetical protein
MGIKTLKIFTHDVVGTPSFSEATFKPKKSIVDRYSHSKIIERTKSNIKVIRRSDRLDHLLKKSVK